MQVLPLNRLKQRVTKLDAEVRELKRCCKDVEKWIKRQVKWNKEVTAMLRKINWAKLAQDYPGVGGTNPPQTPPDWPPNW